MLKILHYRFAQMTKKNINLRPTRIKRQFTKPHTRQNLTFGVDRVQDEVKSSGFALTKG